VLKTMAESKGNEPVSHVLIYTGAKFIIAYFMPEMLVSISVYIAGCAQLPYNFNRKCKADAQLASVSLFEFSCLW
jgi:hypothetical protein